jgi:hypothetical protein
MKYFSLFEDWKKKEEKPNKLKHDTYMFRDVYEDEKGNVKGVCKFCEKNAGISTEVDVAEHTNKCPNAK